MSAAVDNVRGAMGLAWLAAAVALIVLAALWGLIAAIVGLFAVLMALSASGSAARLRRHAQGGQL